MNSTSNKKFDVDTIYPSKLLLFGEYGILFGKMALAVPFYNYSAKWNFSYKDVDENLVKIVSYLKKINSKLNHSLDLDSMEADIGNRLFFDSTIPQKYGLGSSGALTSAIYDRYGTKNKLKESELMYVKEDLALIESFFHGKSSGVDALVSLVKKPLLFNQNSGVPSIHMEIKNNPLVNHLFLIDSGVFSGTDEEVNKILIRIKDDVFKEKFNFAYDNFSKSAIVNFLEGDINGVLINMLELSEFQLNYMRELIPKVMVPYFTKGIKSGDFAVKILGSGGGGLFLGVARNKSIFSNYFNSFKLINSINIF